MADYPIAGGAIAAAVITAAFAVTRTLGHKVRLLAVAAPRPAALSRAGSQSRSYP